MKAERSSKFSWRRLSLSSNQLEARVDPIFNEQDKAQFRYQTIEQMKVCDLGNRTAVYALISQHQFFCSQGHSPSIGVLSNKTSCSFALKVFLEIHVAKCIHISNK
jgi:hypothetical protein